MEVFKMKKTTFDKSLIQLAVGYDCEYNLQAPEIKTSRDIISYQLSVFGNDRFDDSSQIYFLSKGQHRLSLEILLSRFLGSLPMKEGQKSLFSFGYSQYEILKVKSFLFVEFQKLDVDVEFWAPVLKFAAKVFVSSGFVEPSKISKYLVDYVASMLELVEDLECTTSGADLSRAVLYSFTRKFVSRLVRKAGKLKSLSGIVRESPRVEVYFGAHFNIVDLTALLNFSKILKFSDSLGKVQVSIEKPYYITLYSVSLNRYLPVEIHFRDTTALCGGGSLAQVGQTVGLPKIDISAAALDDMRGFRFSSPVKYKAYALRDAEIVAKYMRKFLDEHGFVPPTVGSLSAFRIKRSLNYARPESDARKFSMAWKGMTPAGRYDKRMTPLTEEIGKILLLSTEAYKGGRNESHCHGIFNGLFNDFDLNQAYAMAMIGCGTPDWDAVRPLTGVSEILDSDSDYIVATVDFTFPEDCNLPNLPILDRKKRGLIFPLIGAGIFCKHELILALELGAELKLTDGECWRIPTLGEGLKPEIVKMIGERFKAQEEFGKGSFEDLNLKLMINSAYGKISQGLRPKKTYSTRHQKTTEVKTSSITSAVVACHITGVVRTMVSAAAAGLVRKQKQVLSITTDGLMTDASEADLENNFEISRQYRRWALAADIGAVWSLKHQNVGHVELRTRGSFGRQDGPICKRHFALAGLYLNDDQRSMDRDAKTKFMMNLYQRYVIDGKRIPNNQLRFPSTREIQMEQKEAGIKEEKLVRLSWNYDWKRQIAEKNEHNFTTKPWSSWEDFNRQRTWIKKCGTQNAVERRELVDTVAASGRVNVLIRKNLHLEARKVAIRLAVRGLIKLKNEPENLKTSSRMRLYEEKTNWKISRKYQSDSGKECSIALSSEIVKHLKKSGFVFDKKTITNLPKKIDFEKTKKGEKKTKKTKK